MDQLALPSEASKTIKINNFGELLGRKSPTAFQYVLRSRPKLAVLHCTSAGKQ